MDSLKGKTKLNLFAASISSLSIVFPVLICTSTLLLAGPNLLNSEQVGCLVNFYDENLQIAQSSPNGNLSSLNQTAINLAPANSDAASTPSPSLVGVGLECHNITADQLHDQINKLKNQLSGLKMVSLIVRDSNLSTLSNLPQGTHELKKLILSNTSIDLEVLKEGSESLNQLTTLEITNEKISNIPQNFFQEMQSLKELRLDNDGIASLDGDAFHNLDDSLEILGLRDNRFNRFPMAVKNLARLTVLDLSNNDIVIDTQESDLPEKLELLTNLLELNLNRINCTCDFSSSPFYEWIVRTHIYGVRCHSPEKLKSQEVIVFERDEFCVRSSGQRQFGPSCLNIALTICLMLIMRIVGATQIY